MHPLQTKLQNLPLRPVTRTRPQLAMVLASRSAQAPLAEKKDQLGKSHPTKRIVPVNGEQMRNNEDDSFDRTLLAKIAEGDMQAMRTLYDRQADAISRFARVRLNDHFEVADIVHETMLSAWGSAGSFQGRSAVRTWLLRLAHNKIVDHFRKQSRVTLAEPDEAIPSGDPDAEAVIAAAQDADRVRACVNRLPEGQRAVIQLAFFEELTYADVAKIEGIPEGTVKTRIYHAKKRMLQYLSQG